MKSLLFTMPAAWLLMLCIACNQSQPKKMVASPVTIPSEKADSTAIAGTTNNAFQEQDNKLPDEERMAPQNRLKKNLPAPGKNEPPASSPASVPDPDWDKKIVKTANITLEVPHYGNFNAEFHRSVKRFGGYISQESQTQSAFRIENTITIKVPVDQFDEAIARLSADSAKLMEKKISAEDVTLEAVDTRSRLEAKRQVRLRYLELLKQAKNMEDMLQVQREIDGIQEEMEAAAGRIGYLSHEAAFSTINLNFYQVFDAGTIGTEPKPSLIQKMVSAFKTGLDWGAGFMVLLISLWPLWIFSGLTLIGYRKWRRSGKGQKPISLQTNK